MSAYTINDQRSLIIALEAYCHNTSIDLIIDGDSELHLDGNVEHGSMEHRSRQDDPGSFLEADRVRWEVVKSNIETFLAAPGFDGASNRKSLVEDYQNELRSEELRAFHGDQSIPDDIFELCVAQQLALRKKDRHDRGVETTPTFTFSVVTKVLNSVAAEKKTIQLPRTAIDDRTYASYVGLLREFQRATQSSQTEEEGYPDGYSHLIGPWFYEDFEDPAELPSTYKIFSYALFETATSQNIKHPWPNCFWHSHQLKLQHRDLEVLRVAAAEQKDDSMRAPLAALLQDPTAKHFWSELSKIASAVAPTFMTEKDAQLWWEATKDSDPQILISSLAGLPTEEEMDIIIAQCQSPKIKGRVDSLQTDIPLHHENHSAWDDWICQPNESPLSPEMQQLLAENQRWDAHTDFLVDAAVVPTETDGVGGEYSLAEGLRVADEVLRIGREEETWQQIFQNLAED